jgi:hypothetical protein
MKVDRGCGACRQADEDGFFSCRIESETHIATLSVQLNGLSRGALFYKLSNSPLGIPDYQRAIVLNGNIGHRTAKNGIVEQKKKGK